MARVFTCEMCGKQFESLGWRVKYCSECRSEVGKIRTKQRNQRQREASRQPVTHKAEGLIQASMAAKAAGMTYGQYVAQTEK